MLLSEASKLVQARPAAESRPSIEIPA